MNPIIKRSTALLLAIILFLPMQGFTQVLPYMPPVGQLMPVKGEAYDLPYIVGMRFSSDNIFEFTFILNRGNLPANEAAIARENKKSSDQRNHRYTQNDLLDRDGRVASSEIRSNKFLMVANQVGKIADAMITAGSTATRDDIIEAIYAVAQWAGLVGLMGADNKWGEMGEDGQVRFFVKSGPIAEAYHNLSQQVLEIPRVGHYKQAQKIVMLIFDEVLLQKKANGINTGIDRDSVREKIVEVVLNDSSNAIFCTKKEDPRTIVTDVVNDALDIVLDEANKIVASVLSSGGNASPFDDTAESRTTGGVDFAAADNIQITINNGGVKLSGKKAWDYLKDQEITGAQLVAKAIRF